MSYTIEYHDGRVTEFACDDDTSAELAALARFGDDAVAADQWDSYGRNDEGQPLSRLLIWECEEDSINDNGSKAVASLVRIGNP